MISSIALLAHAGLKSLLTTIIDTIVDTKCKLLGEPDMFLIFGTGIKLIKGWYYLRSLLERV